VLGLEGVDLLAAGQVAVVDRVAGLLEQRERALAIGADLVGQDLAGEDRGARGVGQAGENAGGGGSGAGRGSGCLVHSRRNS
jgi:hypothetical protein